MPSARHLSPCALGAAVALLVARPLGAQSSRALAMSPLCPVAAGAIRAPAPHVDTSRSYTRGIVSTRPSWLRARLDDDEERERRRTRWLAAGATFGAGVGFAIGYARAEIPEDAFVGYQKWTGGAKGAIFGAPAGALLAASVLWVSGKW